MDRDYLEYNSWFQLELPKLPSEYMRTHALYGMVREPLAVKIGQELPDDMPLELFWWGSDFPHSVGTFPRSREYVEETFADLDPGLRHTLLVGNAAEHLEPRPRRRHHGDARRCVADVRPAGVRPASVAAVAVALAGSRHAAARPTDEGPATSPPRRAALERFEPGELIRSEPITAPAGREGVARAVPVGVGRGRPDRGVGRGASAPAGGTNRPRPVVTWAHGTTGVADRCALSQLPDRSRAAAVRRRPRAGAGYVVAATDYEGLGTEGVHPYLVGQSEGRGVLDAARAARDLRAAGAGKQVLVLGHSQGGQAALFAGELAARPRPTSTWPVWSRWRRSRISRWWSGWRRRSRVRPATR